MKRLLIGALCLILCLGLAAPAAFAETDVSELDYYIMNYDVEVVAHSDRSFEITERLSVYFNEESRGITRDIPLYSSLEEVGIRDISVEGAPFSLEGSSFIRIGDPDVYITGQKDYVIRYTLTHYADPEPDYDYLYLNLLPGDAPLIQNFSAVIHLPEGAELNDYTINAGYYGSTGGEEYYTSELRDGAIYVKSAAEFGNGMEITINAQMNEGAFPDAVAWEPQLVIHSIDMQVTVDEYGLFRVDETFTVSVSENYSMYSFGRYITQYSGYSNYRDAVTESLTVRYPDGTTEEKPRVDHYYSVTLADYAGQTVTFGASYNIRYDIRAGTNGEGPLGLTLFALSYDDTAIERIDVTINAPFAIQAADVWWQDSGYSFDRYRSVDGEVTINGSSASLSLSGGMGELPSQILDYGAAASVTFGADARFSRAGRAADAAMPVFGAIALLGAALLSAFTKQSPLTPAVEFYPPKGMNPADMGYIIDGKVDGRDITSLIYYWASHGHLSIEMTSNTKFTLHRLSELEADHAVYEHKMFQTLWAKGNGVSVTSSRLTNSFYTAVQEATHSVNNSFKGERAMYKNKGLPGLFGVLIPLGLMIAAVVVAWDYPFKVGGAIASAFGLFFAAIGVYATSHNIAKERHKKLSGKSIALVVVFGAFAVGMGIAVVNTFGGRMLSIGAAAAFAALTLAVAAAAPYLRKRTAFGTSALNYALGFKQFLQTAEKSRLEMLLEQNPNYYYDILPYAQVLGVSSIWEKKFDGLLTQPPSWYYGVGVDPTRIGYHLSRTLSTMSRSMTSTPAPSGGGSSGGGFSGGGGGGGFSGGGFSGGGSGGGSVGRW